jgi:hypothetical protein
MGLVTMNGATKPVSCPDRVSLWPGLVSVVLLTGIALLTNPAALAAADTGPGITLPVQSWMDTSPKRQQGVVPSLALRACTQIPLLGLRACNQVHLLGLRACNPIPLLALRACNQVPPVAWEIPWRYLYAPFVWATSNPKRMFQVAIGCMILALWIMIRK